MVFFINVVCMRHLSIYNFGPLISADFEIGRLNVIVGPQSSGKSSVLKVAAYFSWLEKRIELTQNLNEASWFNLEEHLIKFYNLTGYVKASTEFKYETECLAIVCKYKIMKAEWKDGRWGYKRSKIAYIPAERNLVSVIANWPKVQTADNILEFMTEWDVARKSRVRALKILNLGVQYSYDESTNLNRVVMENGVNLDMSAASSGLQSLIPLYVNLNYLNFGQYRVRYKMENYLSKSENLKLFEFLVEKYVKGEFPQKVMEDLARGKNRIQRDDRAEEVVRFSRLYDNYTNTKNSQVYLEEPEDNLFPPEQVILMDWLIAMGKAPFRKNVMFIATHSPYIVNSFLEREIKDFNLLITVPASDGMSIVKTASDEDVQKIYDSGSDIFFNFETFV